MTQGVCEDAKRECTLLLLSSSVSSGLPVEAEATAEYREYAAKLHNSSGALSSHSLFVVTRNRTLSYPRLGSVRLKAASVWLVQAWKS